jgi:electron transfer flavoprotein alpha subunit
MTVVVVAETDHGAVTLPSRECIEEAREVASVLGTTVHALLAGSGVAGLAGELAVHGADCVMLIEHESLERFSASAWLAALEPLLQELAPTLVLAPDTGHVRAWLPRLAVRRRVPMVSGCLQVQASAGGQMTLVRPTHGGARHEHLVCPGAATVFATLAPGARGAAAPQHGRHSEVIQLVPQLDPRRFQDRALSTLPPDPRTVALPEAERIVAGGLGIGSQEEVARLQELADALDAALGGTRVIADRGWIPNERFIGTTGQIVSPKLYVALGISGAGQHTSGMNSSETVVVVNNDRTAPMFGLADLGIVGDLRQILPELLAQLEVGALSRQR